MRIGLSLGWFTLKNVFVSVMPRFRKMAYRNPRARFIERFVVSGREIETVAPVGRRPVPIPTAIPPAAPNRALFEEQMEALVIRASEHGIDLLSELPCVRGGNVRIVRLL